MRISSHQRIGIRKHLPLRIRLRRKHHPRQILQIHLMADPHSRRHSRKVIERRLPPLQKRVPFAVPLKLQCCIQVIRPLRAKLIHLHRVIDHQLRRLQRIDLLRIPTQRPHRIPHRRQIHHRRHTRKVLHQHPRRHVSNLGRWLRLRVPRRQKLDVLRRHRLAIFTTQQILQQNPQRKWQPRQIPDARALKRLQTKVVHLLRTGSQRSCGIKAIGMRHGTFSFNHSEARESNLVSIETGGSEHLGRNKC